MFVKKKKFCFRPNNNSVLSEALKFPFLTTYVHSTIGLVPKSLYSWFNIGEKTLTKPQKVSTSFSPLVWSTIHKSQFLVLLNILSCLMDNWRPGKWISTICFVSWMHICFNHGLYVFLLDLKPSFEDRLWSLLWLNSFQERSSLSGKLISSFIEIKKPMLVSGSLTSMQCLISFTFSLFLPLSISALVKWIDRIKTELETQNLHKYLGHKHFDWSF